MEQQYAARSKYKEGFLSKAGKHSFQAWKKRWFVLQGILVKYYPTQDVALLTKVFTCVDKYRSQSLILRLLPIVVMLRPYSWESNTLGAIDFSQVVSLSLSRNAKFGFDVATKTRTYYLSAKSEEEREQWMAAFQNAMKMASEKDQAERAASSPSLRSPFSKEHEEFFKQRSVSKESSDLQQQEKTYENIDDIEQIMAEAEMQSNLENAADNVTRQFRKEVKEAPEIPVQGRSPKLDRGRLARLSALAENEVEDEIAETEATRAGINNLLSQMSLESLDSIDSENLLATSDEEDSEEILDFEEPTSPDSVDNAESLSSAGITPLDATSASDCSLPEGSQSALNKIKELLGVDDDYRSSVTLQDVEKMYNLKASGDSEFPAFELLRKVLQVCE